MPASDCQAATDPIQQMFADKVKEYAKKKAAAGGKLPDASKETEAAIAMELEKVSFRKTIHQFPMKKIIVCLFFPHDF